VAEDLLTQQDVTQDMSHMLDHQTVDTSNLWVASTTSYPNNTIHSTIGFTFSYLLFGKDTCNTGQPLDEARRLAYRSEDFKAEIKGVNDNSHKPLNLKPRDLIKRRIPQNHPNNTKLTSKFDAVHKVVSQLSPVNYEIIKQKILQTSSIITSHNRNVIINGRLTFSTPESETVILSNNTN
jgi:hypothetical protein